MVAEKSALADGRGASEGRMSVDFSIGDAFIAIHGEAFHRAARELESFASMEYVTHNVCHVGLDLMSLLVMLEAHITAHTDLVHMVLSDGYKLTLARGSSELQAVQRLRHLISYKLNPGISA